MFGENFFGVVDYIVLILTLVICLLVGVYYAYFSQHTNEELLVGGRNMSIFPIAASITVSFFSAITILGIPAEIYSFSVEIVVQAVLQAIGVALGTMLIIPFLYPMRITSIYEYYNRRFNSTLLRKIPALIFIVEQIALCGMVLYAPSIALETFLGFPLWLSIFGMGICGSIYTSIGGLKAVVWTDTFQFIILLIGLLAILIKSFMEAGGVGEAFSIAYEGGRLKLLDFTFDPFMRHNFWNFLFGSGFIMMYRTAAHPTLVQRYMSLPSIEHVKKSFLISVPFKLGVMLVMALIGIALYAAMAGCDPVLSKKVTKLDQIVPLFVVEKLAYIPGSLGLFTAAIFSGVLSSLSSSVSAMTAVTWEDFLSDREMFQRMSSRAQANVSRALSFIFGMLAMCTAFAVQNLKFIFAGSYAVTGPTAGASIAVLFMGLYMPFVNKIGAAIGTLVGVVLVIALSIYSLIHPAIKKSLPVRVDQCEIPVTDFTNYNSTSRIPEELSFPYNLNSFSYILYPFLSFLLSISIALIISGFTGGFTQKQIRKVEQKYIHHSVRRFFFGNTLKPIKGTEMETLSQPNGTKVP